MFYQLPYLANSGQGELDGLCLGLGITWRAMMPAQAGYFLGVVNAKYRASLHPRLSVRGEGPHPMAGVSVCAEHSGSTGVNLEK